MAKITRVTITEFTFDVPDIGLQSASAGVGNMAYVKGAVFKPKRFAVKIEESAQTVVKWIIGISSVGVGLLFLLFFCQGWLQHLQSRLPPGL